MRILVLCLAVILFSGCRSDRAGLEVKLESSPKELVGPELWLISADEESDDYAATEIKNAIVEVETADWCGPCQKFKRECKQALIDQGWKVVELPPGGAVPRFTVWVRGESTTWTGYSSRSDFCAKLRSLL